MQQLKLPKPAITTSTNQSSAVKIESLASHVSKQFDISQQDGKIMCY